MNVERAEVLVGLLRLSVTATPARLVVERRHDFVVDERGEHLRLEELRQERPVLRRLVRQERRLVEVVHRLAVLQPLGLVLVGQNHELLVVEKDLAESVEEDLADLRVEPQVVVVLLVVRETARRASLWCRGAR